MFVDQVHEDAFWGGRSWRSFVSIVSLTGVLTYRAVVTKDILLTKLSAQSDTGDIIVDVVVGATPSGTWTPCATVDDGVPLNRNRIIQPTPVSDMQISKGGSITGGVRTDVLRAFTASGGSSQTVSQADGSVRGLPAGTYYFRITGANAALGSLIVEWIEIPAR